VIILVIKNQSKNVFSTKLIYSLVFDSIKLLSKNPSLVIPKLLIAILYGVGIILAVDLSKQLFLFQSFTSEQIFNYDFSYFFGSAVLMLLIAILTFFIDLFFLGFYPVLISLAEKNKFSFKRGFELFKPKMLSILYGGIILWVLFSVFALIIDLILLYFNLSTNSLILSLILIFAFAFLFYFFYPKLVFENVKLDKTFVNSFLISLKNKKLVFVLSLIPFLVSILKFALAYFSDFALSFALFWVLVILTGLIYSVHAVINQKAYEKLSKSKN